MTPLLSVQNLTKTFASAQGPLGGKGQRFRAVDNITDFAAGIERRKGVLKDYLHLPSARA